MERKKQRQHRKRQRDLLGLKRPGSVYGAGPGAGRCRKVAAAARHAALGWERATTQTSLRLFKRVDRNESNKTPVSSMSGVARARRALHLPLLTLLSPPSPARPPLPGAPSTHPLCAGCRTVLHHDFKIRHSQRTNQRSGRQSRSDPENRGETKGWEMEKKSVQIWKSQ